MKQVIILKEKGNLEQFQGQINTFIEGKDDVKIIPLETSGDRFMSVMIVYEDKERAFKERLRDLYEEDSLQFNDIIREMYAEEMRPTP